MPKLKQSWKGTMAKIGPSAIYLFHSRQSDQERECWVQRLGYTRPYLPTWAPSTRGGTSRVLANRGAGAFNPPRSPIYGYYFGVRRYGEANVESKARSLWGKQRSSKKFEPYPDPGNWINVKLKSFTYK